MLLKFVLFAIFLSYSYTFWEEEYDAHFGSDGFSVTPKRPGEHQKTLIWLHSQNGSKIQFQEMLSSRNESPFDDFTKVSMPQGERKVVWKDCITGWSWFDVFDRKQRKDSYNFEEVERSRKYLNKLLDKEIKILKGDASKVMIGGYDQGGALAIHTALNYEKPLGGIISWSGFRLDHTKLPEKKYQNIPIFISNGNKDEIWDYKLVKKTYDKDNFLKKFANQSRHLIRNMTHKKYSTRVIEKTYNFLKKNKLMKEVIKFDPEEIWEKKK